MLEKLSAEPWKAKGRGGDAKAGSGNPNPQAAPTSAEQRDAALGASGRGPAFGFEDEEGDDGISPEEKGRLRG